MNYFEYHIQYLYVYLVYRIGCQADYYLRYYHQHQLVFDFSLYLSHLCLFSRYLSCYQFFRCVFLPPCGFALPSLGLILELLLFNSFLPFSALLLKSVPTTRSTPAFILSTKDDLPSNIVYKSPAMSEISSSPACFNSLIANRPVFLNILYALRTYLAATIAPFIDLPS